MLPAINGVAQTVSPLSSTDKTTLSPNIGQTDFSNTLKEAIKQINDVQIASNSKTEALAKGQSNDLHDVMTTAQKASITLETSVQIQRKVIDAYNEIMRMQV